MLVHSKAGSVAAELRKQALGRYRAEQIYSRWLLKVNGLLVAYIRLSISLPFTKSTNKIVTAAFEYG